MLKNFLRYAGCSLQMSIVLIPVYYFAARNYPTDEKTVSANVTQICPKEVFLVPTILLSSSVEQKLAFHKVVQYLIRSTCLQGPRLV